MTASPNTESRHNEAKTITEAACSLFSGVTSVCIYPRIIANAAHKEASGK